METNVSQDQDEIPAPCTHIPVLRFNFGVAVLSTVMFLACRKELKSLDKTCIASTDNYAETEAQDRTEDPGAVRQP